MRAQDSSSIWRNIRNILAFMLFFATVLFYTWSRYYTTRLGYELSRVSGKERDLLEERKSLKIDMGKLGSLDRIEKVARNRLNMTEPRPEQVVFLTLDERPPAAASADEPQ